MLLLMYSLMWLSTCWIPLVYGLKRMVNYKNVIKISGFKNLYSNESVNISIYSIDDINDIAKDYKRMKITYNMNNSTFVYCSTTEEFLWPIDDTYQYTWIQKANLILSENKESVDVTDIVNMYAGPERNFYNTHFDFNWIPEIGETSANILEIYDNNGTTYNINLKTNTEINNTGIESVRGIKLFCRSMCDFDTM